jgi:hypothetical protein
MSSLARSYNGSVTWTGGWMNWPRKGHGQDPEEVSRGVDAVIVVSAAFSMNSNRGPAPEELSQRRYFDRERKRRSDEHRSNLAGHGRIDLSFATTRGQFLPRRARARSHRRRLHGQVGIRQLPLTRRYAHIRAKKAYIVPFIRLATRSFLAVFWALS